MAFRNQKLGDLEYLTADALSGTAHAFSTRFGGVIEGALSSLNLGVHRGDRKENVVENYRILGAAVGFTPEQTVFTKQEHTDHLRRVGKSDCGTGIFREPDYVADGIYTDEPGVALVCFSADCTPILLCDPVKGVVAAVHSGWRGTAQGIVYKAAETLRQEFGCEPENLRAAIGPCIGGCCFEVGAEVPDAMRRSLGAAAEPAIEARGEKFHVDLKMLNRIWLNLAGVKTVDVSEECTMCRPDRFWSHRVTGGNRGSLAAVIMRKE